uniref:Glu-AdT subunit C n=1 Tax=Strongyloides stercoralis TaxID=6248 RepID=A0A0K0EQJ0_STRER
MYSRLHLFKSKAHIVKQSRSLKNFIPQKVYQNKINYDALEPVQSLDDNLLNHLQQISLLKFTQKDIDNLKEDISMANAIFQCKEKTKNVEPLYSVINEISNCPTREDIPELCDKKAILENTKNKIDDYFASPEPNKELDKFTL